MAKRVLRVYRDGNVWVVKKDGFNKASAIRNTKSEALQAARNIALNQNLDVVIHGSDNKIQKRISPKDNDDDGGGCFLTTACVNHFNLKDNCYELETLRSFRDNYLLNSGKKNKQLVKRYYSIAPEIVSLLETDANKTKLYKEIFQQIKCACTAVEKKDFETAKSIYRNTVIKLSARFNLI